MDTKIYLEIGMKNLVCFFLLALATSCFCNCFACDVQELISASNPFKPELKAWICKNRHYVHGTNTCPQCGDVRKGSE